MRRFALMIGVVLAWHLIFGWSHATAEQPVQKKGWSYSQQLHHPGTRSEYVSGRLTYQDRQPSFQFGPIITPVGRYVFLVKSWPPNDPGSWMPWSQGFGDDGISCFRTEDAVTVEEDISPDQLRRGCYRAGFNERLAGTPAFWFYAVRPGYWVDPAKSEAVLEDLKAAGVIGKVSTALKSDPSRQPVSALEHGAVPETVPERSSTN